jgi:hypothetical protein
MLELARSRAKLAATSITAHFFTDLTLGARIGAPTVREGSSSNGKRPSGHGTRMKIHTKAVHAGDRRKSGAHVPVTTPIHTATSYFYESMAQLDRVFAEEEEGYGSVHVRLQSGGDEDSFPDTVLPTWAKGPGRSWHRVGTLFRQELRPRSCRRRQRD